MLLRDVIFCLSFYRLREVIFSLSFYWLLREVIFLSIILQVVERGNFLCIILQVVDTENELVEYKEALVFAFFGLRSLLNVENVFASVTGSRADTVSGSIHHGTLGHSKPSLHDRFNFMIRKRSSGVNELRIIKEK